MHLRQKANSVITHLRSSVFVRESAAMQRCFSWCPQWLWLNFNRIDGTLGWHNSTKVSGKQVNWDLWLCTVVTALNARWPCKEAPEQRPTTDLYWLLCLGSPLWIVYEVSIRYRARSKWQSNCTVFYQETPIPTSTHLLHYYLPQHCGVCVCLW